MNLALKEHEAQLITTCHQWNNNDVFPFPKRIMPECQLLYGCINKAGEGASKGEKIFQITNAMKFHAKRELPVKWLHTIGTGHKCGSTFFNDRIFNRKIVCEGHFTEHYFKKDVELALLGNSCTDIKPRTLLRPGRLRKVSQSNVLSYHLRRFCFAILFD